MSGFVALFTERPYVVAFFTAFALLSWSERGGRRTFLWLGTGTALGWLSEFCSINTGFPFGYYLYHQANFPSELWIGPVPLFASLSFAFMSYFAFSAACRLLAPGDDLAANGHEASLRLAVGSTLLAAIIGTWMDTVIDPLSLLGQYWFLGDLYAYADNGVHFNVPLTNYAGWLFTSACIVLVNQLLDALLHARGVEARGFHLPYKPFWALCTVFGNFAFIIGVSVYLVAWGDVPSSEHAAQVLASGIAISALFAVFAAVMLRRALERTPPLAPAMTPTAREA